MKKLILVLAAVIGSQAQAVSVWDNNMVNDLMKVTCYVGSGTNMQETIVAERANARKPLEINAIWKEPASNSTVKKTFKAELVYTLSEGRRGEEVVIQGVQNGNVFDLSYFPRMGGQANLAVDGKPKNYTSYGGLTCIGIFRKN